MTADDIIHSVLAAAFLPLIASALRVWATQRSDHRAFRDLERRTGVLEHKADAALEVKASVDFIGQRLVSIESESRHLAQLSVENNGVLNYLKGRADEADARASGRRVGDPR